MGTKAIPWQGMKGTCLPGTKKLGRKSFMQGNQFMMPKTISFKQMYVFVCYFPISICLKTNCPKCYTNLLGNRNRKPPRKWLSISFCKTMFIFLSRIRRQKVTLDLITWKSSLTHGIYHSFSVLLWVKKVLIKLEIFKVHWAILTLTKIHFVPSKG